ncbi:MAG: porphobilinogen synthase [Methanomicrobiales archaeon]|nr:porphobilinogen synthase [Methanomicrobiales archaeon]
MKVVFPITRMRRLRQPNLLPLFQEHALRKEQIIAPIFIDETIDEPKPVSSMPGVYRYTVDGAATYAAELHKKGIRGVLLFGIPYQKSDTADAAFASEGVVQRSISAIRDMVPNIVICTDVCACEYTTHGHCGIVGDRRKRRDVINDPSLDLMEAIAVSHARAGADIVAPSCMLDGVVAHVRLSLDEAGFEDTLIMSYSTKFASALYGPFREAADSGYIFGDRTTYQLNPANGREAFRESVLDAEEGADILMVKPAGMYLDVLTSLTQLGLPLAAYQVSGEYAMIKAAAERGWIKEREVVLESLLCLKRAGADLIITYFANEVAGWLDEK